MTRSFVFVDQTFSRSPLTRFNNMSDGINDLVSELSGAQPNMQTASQ